MFLRLPSTLRRGFWTCFFRPASAQLGLQFSFLDTSTYHLEFFGGVSKPHMCDVKKQIGAQTGPMMLMMLAVGCLGNAGQKRCPAAELYDQRSVTDHALARGFRSRTTGLLGKRGQEDRHAAHARLIGGCGTNPYGRTP